MNKKILESKLHPLRKIFFEDGGSFYTVAFYDKEDNSINLCVSSQIGCIERCTFCATGDAPFLGNISKENMYYQYLEGIRVMGDFIKKNDSKLLYIIVEGMGEPSFNLENCLEGFKEARKIISDQFERNVFRISTAGNSELINPYIQFIKSNQNMRGVDFQFQVSLHSPFDEERKKLIPILGRKYLIKEIVDRFTDLADFLNSKVKFNYLLLNFSEGGNNYSKKHLEELIKIVNPQKTRIKLTKYSDTGKRFSSPDNNVYKKVKDFLESNGVKTQIRELYGADINAACGMLHYEQK